MRWTQRRRNLAKAFRKVGSHHAEEVDLFHICRRLAEECDGHAERLEPFAERYGEDAPPSPTASTRTFSAALARAGAELLEVARGCEDETARQLKWILTR